MSITGKTIVDSMPPLVGNGLPPVDVVFSQTEFEPTSPPTSYTDIISDTSKLVGSDECPYQPVANPNYVKVLYSNVYNINNSLTNDISGIADDNRMYPTAFAVQKYVQSQLTGIQIIDASANNTNIVSTSFTNTIITELGSEANLYEYSLDSISTSVYVYTMNPLENAPRVGASKQILLGVQEIPDGNLIYLYAGDGNAFVVAGKMYPWYQFTYIGAFVELTQIYKDGKWTFFINNYSSVFSGSDVGVVDSVPFDGVTLKQN
jgi:hypothetical protein